jgi:uncharacterized protein (TIGR04255 family)
MNPVTKLSRAPVIEALIDLRVVPRPELTMDQLASVREKLGTEDFPETNKQITGTIQLGDAMQVVASSHTGLLFRNVKHTEVVQAQREGFAYSRLAPYTSWEDLVGNARTRWMQYIDVARPVVVKRIAARYINQLPLPVPVANFSDWIAAFPEIPRSLPQGIADCLQRLVIPIPGRDQTTAIVMLGLAPPSPNGNVVTVVFDIDVFRLGEWQVEADEVWRGLEELRPIKNAFFFEYVTARTLELFK